MISALLAFLSGSFVRAVWGEISSFINKRADNAHELQMLQLQLTLDDRAHARNQEALQLQATLGIKTIEAQSLEAVNKAEADAFGAAIVQALKPTGITFVDVWNGVVRPAAATIALGLWVGKLVMQNFQMQDWDTELVGAILGFFFADRSLTKRLK